MSEERDLLVGAGIADVSVSGIGKVNAAATATELIFKSHPDAVINSGVAGSMDRTVRVGDFVVATQTAYHDVWCGDGTPVGCVQGQPPRFDADPSLLAAARELAQTSYSPDCGGLGDDSAARIHFGLIASGDQFYWDENEDLRIIGLYPDALACDMESAAIAQVCRRYGVPFISVRLVSDVHGNNEVQASSYRDFWASAANRSAGFLLDFYKKINSMPDGLRLFL